MYEYAARLIRVVDGDTVDLELDLGLDIRFRQRVRLYGLNAPEHGSPAGEAATTFVRAWFEDVGELFLVQTRKDKREKYGRYLGVILSPSMHSLNDALIQEGHAFPWDGLGARPIA